MCGGSMAKPSHATWGGRFSAGPAELMLQFSESVSFDRRLAPFDVAGSKAHSAMLAHVGLITAKERNAIHAGLDAILMDIAAGKFVWDTQLEDVHMNIERALTKRVPAAAKLHTARSRNDQVATDMRLFFKFACEVLAEKIRGAQLALLAVADANRDVLIPGYTHLQRAQPVLLAHHLFAWLEMLERDRARLEVASHYGCDVLIGDATAWARERDGLGVDGVIDAAGASAALKAALELVRPNGWISKVGWGPQPLGFSLDPLVQKNITLQGSFSHNWPIWERVLSLLASGRLDVRPILGGVWPLESWHEAFEKMHGGEIVKAVLRPTPA